MSGAMVDQINIPIRPLVRGIKITCNLTGIRTFRTRLWLGAKLIALGAWVIGCSVEIVNHDGSNARAP